jgi:hypothetical protein
MIFNYLSFLKLVVKFILDKDNQRFILFAVVVLLFLVAARYRSAYKTEQEKVETQIENVKVLSDSVTTYRNKNNELGFEKRALVTEVSDLKIFNDSLYQELKKEKENVKVITITEVEIKRDTLKVPVYITQIPTDSLSDRRFKLEFDSEVNGDSLYSRVKGYTKFAWNDTLKTPYDAYTMISDNTIKLKIISGIKNTKNGYSMFYRSPYGGFSVIDIDGAVIDKIRSDKRSKRFGVGLSSGMQFNGRNFLPYIGIGVNYNIIRF